MPINQKKIISKVLTVLTILGCIAFGVLKSIAKNPPHFASPNDVKYDYKTINLQEKINEAIKKDDWFLLQTLYQKCKIEEEDGFKYWSPRNCKPILLIQNSVKFKAKKVYQGLANDPKYELSRSWKDLEENNFKYQPERLQP